MSHFANLGRNPGKYHSLFSIFAFILNSLKPHQFGQIILKLSLLSITNLNSFKLESNCVLQAIVLLQF